ncbi:MAG TPA: hypothetical protein VG963_07575 [Polyangiaceae bacterium]|nr:hypothetical protein [Polyangiaceae bacterium]
MRPERESDLAKVHDIAWRHGFIAKDTPAATAAKQRTELLADLRRLVNTGVVQLGQLSSSVRAMVQPSRRVKQAA